MTYCSLTFVRLLCLIQDNFLRLPDGVEKRSRSFRPTDDVESRAEAKIENALARLASLACSKRSKPQILTLPSAVTILLMLWKT